MFICVLDRRKNRAEEEDEGKKGVMMRKTRVEVRCSEKKLELVRVKLKDEKRGEGWPMR